MVADKIKEKPPVGAVFFRNANIAYQKMSYKAKIFIGLIVCLTFLSITRNVFAYATITEISGDSDWGVFVSGYGTNPAMLASTYVCGGSFGVGFEVDLPYSGDARYITSSGGYYRYPLDICPSGGKLYIHDFYWDYDDDRSLVYEFDSTGKIIDISLTYEPTRIISFEPANASTTASNDVYFNLEYYVSPLDVSLSSLIFVDVYFQNIDNNNWLPFSRAGEYTQVLEEGQLFNSGFYSFSTTTYLADGNYRLYARLCKADWSTFWNQVVEWIGGNNCIEANHSFIVRNATFSGTVSNSLFNSWFGFNQGESATSTATSSPALALMDFCMPFFGQFSVAKCLEVLFKPDPNTIADMAKQSFAEIKDAFPFSYLFDVYDVFASTSVYSPLSISAVVPSGVVGSGSEIELSVASSSLSWLYNATSSGFMNLSSGNSDDTFFETTNYYVKWIVYLSLIFYIVARILGSRFIPNLKRL